MTQAVSQAVKDVQAAVEKAGNGAAAASPEIGLRSLSADDIFNVDDREPVPVYVEEWKGNVLLRPLTAAAALEFADYVKKDEKTAGIKLLIESAVDENGNPLFTMEAIEKLKKKSLRPLTKLTEKALVMNGLKEAPKEAAAAKNA